MKFKIELSENDLKEIITEHFSTQGKVVKKIDFHYTTGYYDRTETQSYPQLSRVEVEVEYAKNVYDIN